MTNVKNIGILGSGTWGVALARLLQRNGHHVTVWSKFQQEVDSLNTTRVHPNLPGLTIAKDIIFTADITVKIGQIFIFRGYRFENMGISVTFNIIFTLILTQRETEHTLCAPDFEIPIIW